MLHHFGHAAATDPKKGAAVDIIFVHGLTGNYIKTWSAGDSDDAFWPKWLADDFPTVNVYSLQYDSSIFSSVFTGSGPSLIERAAILFDFLRSRQCASPHILFIAHSLGGLIVKQLLRRCNDMPGDDHELLLKSTAGICFLGTPHQGASLAASVCNILNLTISKSIKELAHGHTTLVDLSEWFRMWAGKTEIIVESYHETVKTKGVMVVDAVTANPYVSTCSPVAVQCDHIQIAKVSSRQSQVYMSITHTLRKLIYKTQNGGSTGGGGKEIIQLYQENKPATYQAVPLLDYDLKLGVEEELYNNLMDEYEFYTSKVSDDRLDLEQKLTRASREAEIARAKRKKERFSIALHRSAAQFSSLRRYIHLMSQVDGRYARHVSALVERDASNDEINLVVQEKVIDRIYSINKDTPMEVTESVIDDCIYYLTGNCHIWWDHE